MKCQLCGSDADLTKYKYRYMGECVCNQCYQYLLEQERKHYNKPPIGLMLQSYWEKRRRQDIIDAVNRYTDARMEIPIEWIAEYNQLCGDRTTLNKE